MPIALRNAKWKNINRKVGLVVAIQDSCLTSPAGPGGVSKHGAWQCKQAARLAGSRSDATRSKANKNGVLGKHAHRHLWYSCKCCGGEGNQGSGKQGRDVRTEGLQARLDGQQSCEGCALVAKGASSVTCSA